jgi:uncharacterized protein (TIGR02284 family)
MSTSTLQPAAPGDLVYLLNACIETCTDGEKGYAAAAADVRDPALKSLFQQKSLERADFVQALQAAISRLGAFPENEGTATGTAHRGWMDVRLALEGHKDRVIVEEWGRGEEGALKAYHKALSRTPLGTLPPEIRSMIEAQYVTIHAGVEEARRRLTTVHR